MSGRARGRLGCIVAFGACAAAASAASCGGSSFSNASGDAAVADAAGDASVVNTNDASPGPDTGAGDVVASDGPPDATASGYCGTHPNHTFCEDFDGYPTVTAFLGAWSSFEQNAGTFRFDTSGAPSAPNALEAQGSNGAKVIVLKTLPVRSSATRLRMDFDLRINSSGSVGFLSGAGLAALAFGSSISDGFAAMSIGNGPSLTAAWADSADAGMSDAGTFKSTNASGAFPGSGVWAARYAIEVDYSSTGGCVQIYEGPTSLLSTCLPLPPRLLHPSVVSLVLGDYTAGFGSTGSIDVEFDDVTFDEM